MTGSVDRAAERLSVVLVPFTGQGALIRFLETFVAGNDLDQIEVVLPCDDRIDNVDTLGRKFPEVQIVACKGIRTYAELRATGIRHSHGQIVAITEAQCIPHSDWCDCILRAHQSSHSVIGGVVDKRHGSALGWAMYFYDYGRYMPPIDSGPAACLTDCNVSYKRNVLEASSDLWSNEFHETSVHWALQERGVELWLDRDIVVLHAREPQMIEALRDRYEFGRLYASTRVAAITKRQRYMLMATLWLLPGLVAARTARTVLSKRRHLRPFVWALPYLLLIGVAWSLGEWLGYVTGRAGRSLSPDNPQHQASKPAVSA